MSLPIIQDLSSQRSVAKRFLLKASLLLLILLAVDRLLGSFLRAGLDRYYGLDTAASVLCVGHSHTVLGIDKVRLEKELGTPVAKFAVEGANTADRAMMIRYYFSRQPSSVRAVVYDVDAHTFTGEGLSSSSYRLLFPFVDDEEMSVYIRGQCESETEYWLRRILCSTRYNELLISLSVRGHLRKWSNFKFGKLDVGRLKSQVREGRFRRIQFNPAILEKFAETLRFVSGRGCTMVLAYIPTTDILNQAEPEQFKRSMETLTSCSVTNANSVLLDYNRDLQGCHDLFFDPIHLNPEGQKEVTSRLAKDLRKILEKQATAAVERSNQATVVKGSED